MKKERTYPNIFWIAFQLLISLPILWFGLVIFFEEVFSIEMPFTNPDVSPENPSTEDIMYGIAYGLCITGGGFFMLCLMAINWCNVSMSDAGFTFVKPLQLKKKTIRWQDIRGFSTSQSCHFRSGSSESVMWCFDSVVIYGSKGEVVEIISGYNFGFKVVEKTLRQRGVEYLGFEPHEPVLLGFIGRREYKFLDDKQDP